MKIPNEIPVLGSVYKVEIDEKIEKSGAEGLTLLGKQVIKISPKVLEVRGAAKRTLWHELGHAFLTESGLYEILDDHAQEMFCQNFAAFVIQTTGGNFKKNIV